MKSINNVGKCYDAEKTDVIKTNIQQSTSQNNRNWEMKTTLESIKNKK